MKYVYRRREKLVKLSRTQRIQRVEKKQLLVRVICVYVALVSGRTTGRELLPLTSSVLSFPRRARATSHEDLARLL